MQNRDDSQRCVAELKTAILDFAKERDWLKFHTAKNLSMALAAESGELMEHFLWEEPEGVAPSAWSPEKRAKIEEELADVIIYALEFANVAQVDVSQAIQTKMAKNAVKYPVEKAKGRATKYTEL